MNISKNKIVSVIYELKTDPEGEVLEKAVKDTPLTFLCGAGQMLEKFEANLLELKVGDTFDFKLKSSEAYGDASEEAVVDLPKNIFEINGQIDEEMIKEGNVVPMRDSAGKSLNGIVLEVTDDMVKMDFNHPLAGDDLYFNGEVIEVRNATEEEIQQAYSPQSGCNSNGEGCNKDCSSC